MYTKVQIDIKPCIWISLNKKENCAITLGEVDLCLKKWKT